ncbi:MAG: SprB repeat-containing protein [Saprospiraceae bacterium]|nr:SprB repeat-containing protein [Saprospiraceae bacterium]
MGSINRTYTIESNPDTPIPSEMDFTFRYLDGEVSGSEANLTIFKSDGSGGTWTAQSSILNTSANTLVQNDVADITNWWTAFPCTNAPYVFFYQSPETHLCDGITYALTPANTGGPASAYEWILDGDTLGLNEDHYSITGVEGTPNQTLEFIAYDSLGCYDRAIVTIVHEDTLIVDIGPNLALCQGASHTFTAAYPGDWKVDGIPQGNPQIPMSSFNFIANNYSPGPHAVTIAVYLNYCNAFDTVTVIVNPTPTVEITPPYSTVCEVGTTDLTANPTGGTAPYDYNWNYGGASTQTVSVPNATTVYTVTLTDANSCTATDNMGMNFVNIILTETHTQPICFGEGLGSIDLTISTPNGCPGIIWSNGATTEDLTGLEAGTYTVTVSNASNGCTDTQFFDCSKTLSVTLVGPSAALETSSNVTNVLCHGDGNGLIDLVVSGGTDPYSYLWSNGATTQDLNMLSGGTYSVTVTDANLCTTTNSIVVLEPDPVGQPPFTPPTITSVTCNGDGDGAIAWTIEGGTAPYGFSWTGPGGFTATTEDLVSLDGGNYNVTVTDANNCTYSTNMTVPEPAPLAAVVTPHNISCFGSSDGYIVISDPTGGTAPLNLIGQGQMDILPPTRLSIHWK